MVVISWWGGIEDDGRKFAQRVAARRWAIFLLMSGKDPLKDTFRLRSTSNESAKSGNYDDV